jgi:N-acetylneuraminate synthase/N,N'-diacetyllegionaminate synthase
MNALEWIDPYMEFYKIGSGDLTAYPFLKKIAQIGKPMIISTGLATLEEVRNTVALVQSVDKRYNDANYLALLQCTSSYPLPESDVNLSVMKTLQDEFDVTVGYSDHTTDSYAAELAVCMGAEILELHFTDDKERPSFRDHQVSFTIQGISNLIDNIERIKKLQGSPDKHPTESEIESGHVNSFRRGVYTARNISRGEVLSESDLVVLRPKRNVDASLLKKILGNRLNKSVRKLHEIDFSLLN